MQFTRQLIKGSLIKRYKRFLADVVLEDGSIVTAHCPNTGAMTGCAEPGFEVWLSRSDNPKRKLAYSWELSVDFDGNWIGVNTQRANQLTEEGITLGKVNTLAGYSKQQREVKYGSENSRIDLLLSGPDQANCYVEVKSVTLLDSGTGFFPDAVTQRGTKHLRELTEIAAQGNRAVLLFCVQHTGITSVNIAKHIDPDYFRTITHAAHNGVEIIAWDTIITQEKIELNQEIECILQKKG